MSWRLIKQIKQLPDLNKPVLIEGLPGIGNTGKIAIDFLVDELEATRVYSLFSHSLPNSVFVNEQNLVELPSVEIYYKKFNNKKKHDLIFLTGDVQPATEQSSYDFCQTVVNMLKQFGGKELITTGGIGLSQIPEKPKVFITGNTKKIVNLYARGGVEKKIHGIVGPIIGVSGLLIGIGNMHNVNGVALLAETFGHPMYLGVKGAREILSIINKRFSMKIDLKKLSKEIEKLEKETIKKTKDLNIAKEIAKMKKPQDVSYIG